MGEVNYKEVVDKIDMMKKLYDELGDAIESVLGMEFEAKLSDVERFVNYEVDEVKVFKIVDYEGYEETFEVAYDDDYFICDDRDMFTLLGKFK